MFQTTNQVSISHLTLGNSTLDNFRLSMSLITRHTQTTPSSKLLRPGTHLKTKMGWNPKTLIRKTNERLPKPRFYSVFPFAISFANLSRCGVFLSRHPRVWNTLSRAFAENPEKNLCFLANTYWNICSPPAMWTSQNFIRAACRPSPLPPPPPPSETMS